MSKLFIGIDNGKKGGIVVINDNRRVVLKTVMPVIGTKKKEYDVREISDILKRYPADLVVLEKVMVMGPMTSKVGAMSNGWCLGFMEGLCNALDLPYVIVRPQEWQKHVFKGLGGKDTKSKSILYAKRMYPLEDWRASERCKKDHDGLTDGACLALYGLLHYG